VASISTILSSVLTIFMCAICFLSGGRVVKYRSNVRVALPIASATMCIGTLNTPALIAGIAIDRTFNMSLACSMQFKKVASKNSRH